MSEAPILRLPDELLIEMVNHLIEEERHSLVWYRYEYKTRVALARTCTLFHLLVIPTLYRLLSFTLDPHGDIFLGEMGYLRSSKLYRTLADNPPLRHHCRNLTLSNRGGHATKERLDTVAANLVR
jgi:hypothetical protein